MIRTMIQSDLHTEFDKTATPYTIPSISRDLLILAGDIHLGTKADKLILNQLIESDVIYVLGNHEFYNQCLPAVRSAWSGPTKSRINTEAATLGYRGRLHVLDDSAVTINDVTFIGATLWTDFNGGNPVDMNEARLGMNDYRIIYTLIDNDDFSRKIPLQPEDTTRLHSQSLQFIETELKKPGKKVLIVHHLPSYQSISEGYRGNPLNPAYASNLDRLFDEYDDIELCIHGHAHQTFSYDINGTPIICNPRGYTPDQLNPLFDPELIINIG